MMQLFLLDQKKPLLERVRDQKAKVERLAEQVAHFQFEYSKESVKLKELEAQADDEFGPDYSR